MAEKIHFEAIASRLKHFKTAMLTTVNADGRIHSRPMMTQDADSDADLWFVSALDCEKVSEIQAHPQVGVIYYRDADNAYFSIAGDARIITEPKEIRRRWKDEWRMWFPEGPENSRLCLIKIDAREAEYWEPTGTRLTVMFEQARAALTGEHPELKPPVKGEIV